MPETRCPHCDTAAFTVAGWVDPDRCPRCGRALAQPQRLARDEQMELISSRRGELRYAFSRRRPDR